MIIPHQTIRVLEENLDAIPLQDSRNRQLTACHREPILFGEGKEEKVHGLPFSWNLEVVIVLQNKALRHSFRTEGLFGQYWHIFPLVRN